MTMNQYSEVLATLLILLACSTLISGNVRKKREDAISLGPLHHITLGCEATEVKVIDEYTFEIIGHKYNGQGPNAFHVVSKSDILMNEYGDPRPVVVALQEGTGCTRPLAFTGQTVRVKLPKGHKVQDYKYLGLFCLRYNHNFCYVRIPDGIKPPAGETTLEECRPEYIDGADPTGARKTEGGDATPSSGRQIASTWFLLVWMISFEGLLSVTCRYRGN